MYKIGVDFLKNGMIVAKSIYDCDGKVLLATGVEIRETYINRLKELDIREIYIQEEEMADILIEDVIQEQNRMEARKIVRNMMEHIRMGESIEAEKAIHRVEMIIDDLLNHPNIMVQLCDIRAVDDYTFAHSVNVCILSIIVGISLNYDHRKLKELGIGALLHDVGKMWIPDEILNKPDTLNDEEFLKIKEHAESGYELLKKVPGIPRDAEIVALAHHERYNGSGYPFGKKGEDIHEYARIVAITDVYDALTSDRIYKGKILPHQAIEYLITMGNHLFDAEIVKHFIKYIATYPMGYGIKLSTGEKGIVIDSNHSLPTRPRVRILYDETGKKCTYKKEIDLAKYPSIMIVDVLEKLW